MSEEDNFSEDAPKLPSHIAYNVEKGTDNKNHWQKIGAAWPTKDGGLSLQINAMPLNGKIALRSREALERMREERSQTQEQAPDMNPSQ
jgi:hypothetical protein